MSFLSFEPQHPGNRGGTPQTLIHDPQLRLQIHVQKETKVLQWLKTEMYSSPEVLTLVLGLSHSQSLHKILMAMQEQGSIRQSKVPAVGGHQTLWGITEHGQAMAHDPSKNNMTQAIPVLSLDSEPGFGLTVYELRLFIIRVDGFPQRNVTAVRMCHLLQPNASANGLRA